MRRVLIPVGESATSLQAVRQAVRLATDNRALQVHLLNVQPPLPHYAARFLSLRARADFHRERAELALAPARTLLASHGIAFREQIRLGRKPETIVAEARSLGCDHILMSTARRSSLTRLLEGSTTNRVLELADVPVQLVVAGKSSPLERYGVPAALAAALALLIAAAVD